MKIFFRWFIRFSLIMALLGGIALAILWAIIVPNLPDITGLKDIRLEVPLRVYSADNKLMGIFGERRRIPVKYEELPKKLINAFIAGEDARFFVHPGIDYQGLTRAAFQLIRTGEKTQGGSTITQQLARNFYLSSEKTYLRKIREIFLAIKIENAFTKEEILTLYLNKIFLGHRAYGVGAAAEVYYGKTLHELSVAQAAMLAALPKAPSRINPISGPERALIRRNYVLSRMHQLDYLSEAEYQQAKNEKDRASYHGPSVELRAPYLAEMARSEAIQKLGKSAYTGGYSLHMTVNSKLQLAANLAIKTGLDNYDRRHGYRGAEASIDLAANDGPEQWREILQNYQEIAGLIPALVTEISDDLALVYLADGQTIGLDINSVSWARAYIDHDRREARPKQVGDVLQPGDVIRISRVAEITEASETPELNEENEGLESSESPVQTDTLGAGPQWRLAQLPAVEGALVSLNPLNGDILALVGGYDFQRSHFNRVTQSLRQPGSGFKPFVYSAALSAGITPATLINDAPVVFNDPLLEKTWKPQNYSEKFFGPTRLREAMIHSRNLVSIRLLREIGIGNARNYIARFGIDKNKLPQDLSMALGSGSLTPLSIARGYAVFANGGYLVDVRFVDRIENASGQVVYSPEHTRVCPDCISDEQTSEASPEEATVTEFKPLEISSINDEAVSTVSARTTENIRIGREILAPQIIPASNAWQMRSLMRDVIRFGTGRKALELKRNDLSGKTGTTNDQRDAWFSGYNSDIVTTVWVGFDDSGKLGGRETGGQAALPIWNDFMKTALIDSQDNYPQMADGLVKIKIDKETGLASKRTGKDIIDEYFEFDNLPDNEASDETDSENIDTTEEDDFEVF
ncbi:MAG: penicillin-binding protein 1A [Xanthomonadales bacterium]|nr:penicillin-binding protein 1A [Xanthomonadales bacterium]